MAEPRYKDPEIRKFQSDLMGADVEKSIHADVCVSCKGPATAFNDATSRQEFTISGLCQKCQDAVFDSDEDDEEED